MYLCHKHGLRLGHVPALVVASTSSMHNTWEAKWRTKSLAFGYQRCVGQFVRV